jgi:hypothetical protein
VIGGAGRSAVVAERDDLEVARGHADHREAAVAGAGERWVAGGERAEWAGPGHDHDGREPQRLGGLEDELVVAEDVARADRLEAEDIAVVDREDQLRGRGDRSAGERQP